MQPWRKLKSYINKLLKMMRNLVVTFRRRKMKRQPFRYRCNNNPQEVKRHRKTKRHRMEVKFKLTDV